MRDIPVRFVASVSLSTLLVGCSLADPYIRPSAANATQVTACRVDCTIDQAQQYSRVQREAYRDRLSAYAKLRYNTGATNIVLGALALGITQGRAHRDNLIGLGLIGGTNYGLATWYGNKPLEALYANAYQALVCAENAVEPLRIAKPLQATLRTGVSNFNAHYAPALQALIELDVVVAEVAAVARAQAKAQGKTVSQATALQINQRNAALQTRADLELASAKSRFAALRASYAKAIQLQQASGTAGNRLARTVDRVVATVDKELQSALPDPNASQSIIANLGLLAAKVVPGLELRGFEEAAPAVKTGRQSGSVDSRALGVQVLDLEAALDRAVANLNRAFAMLEGIELQLQAVVQSVPVSDIAAALKACNVDASEPMSVSPASLSLSASATMARFVVSGGKSPYVGVVIGEQVKDLIVVNPVSGDRGFGLTRTQNTPAGSARLLVSDAAGNQVEVPVSISAVQPATQDQPAQIPATQVPVQPDANDTRVATAKALLDVLQSLEDKRLSDDPEAVGYHFKFESVAHDAAAKKMQIKLRPTPSDAVEKASIEKAIRDKTIRGGESIDQALSRLSLTLDLT